MTENPGTSPSRAAPTGPAAERDSALDGVRGVAVLTIVLVHGFTVESTGLLTGLVHNLFESLFIGVDLFFVLSGFLITSILIRSRGSEGYLRQFYWRRLLRIVPAYLIVIFVCFALLPLWSDPRTARALHEAALPHLLYVQNLVAALRGPMPPGVTHLWSLAVEEQFYALWPLVVLLVPLRLLPQLCVGVFAASCLCKLALFLGGASWLTLYVFTPCHVEGLAAGAWIAGNRQIQGVLAVPRWLKLAGALAAAGLLVLGLAVSSVKLFDPAQVLVHNLLSGVAFAWLVYALAAAQPASALRRFFDNRVLRLFGTYSYGIYLIGWVLVLHLQYPLARRLAESVPENAALLCSGVAVAALNLALAMLMYHAVEKPVLGFKDRGPGRRRRTAQAAAMTETGINGANPAPP
jgi:peptidoglycan/LPS O-acetylase OafA/YrhL